MTGLGQTPNIHSQDQWENQLTHFKFCKGNWAFPLEQRPVSLGSVSKCSGRNRFKLTWMRSREHLNIIARVYF